jgi:membrane protein YdbS with pleckstrin-like domain
MGSRSRRVTAIAGLFYVVLIVGNGTLASWYAAVHDQPWVAIGVGMLAVVALALTVRIIRNQYASDRDGQAASTAKQE